MIIIDYSSPRQNWKVLPNKFIQDHLKLTTSLDHNLSAWCLSVKEYVEAFSVYVLTVLILTGRDYFTKQVFMNNYFSVDIFLWSLTLLKA